MLGFHHSTACKAEELTATIQPGLHHTAMKWLFLASESLLFGLFIFFTHTHHTTYSAMHWLLVTTQENERKVRRSLRKRRKTCVTIIVGNRTRNLSIGNRFTYHCTIWDTHTHTHTHTPRTSDLPIAEAMIANSYVRYSNFVLELHHSTACKADELTATMFSLVSTTQLIEVTFSGK